MYLGKLNLMRSAGLGLPLFLRQPQEVISGAARFSKLVSFSVPQVDACSGHYSRDQSDYSGSNTAQPCEGEQQPLSMYPYNQYW